MIRLALEQIGPLLPRRPGTRMGINLSAGIERLPVDYLKIDGSFVTEMLDNPVDRAMVVAIVEIGRIMGLDTIAEHVDGRTLEYAQGFELGAPRPLAELLTGDP